MIFTFDASGDVLKESSMRALQKTGHFAEKMQISMIMLLLLRRLALLKIRRTSLREVLGVLSITG